MTLGSGDLGQWRLREVVTLGSGDLGNIAWDLCWGGSRRTKHCVFSGRVAAAGDEGQLVCEAVAAAVALTCVMDSSMVFAMCGCSCVRSYNRVSRNRWLQIAVSWLHECCAYRCMRVCQVMLQNAL